MAAADFEFADSRLEMALFAAAPEIATPVGAVCDARGRLLVVESHTHIPPKDYKGPKHDRIKVFTDADGDGRPESSSIFAEGFQAALGCAFAPDGALYVVCAGEVWRLEDRDGDSRAETRRKVLTLETKETYPHNKLLSLAFGPDGLLYFGRGGQIGPDLSGLGQSASRENIIHSILRPSDEFAPQWQAWIIETQNGELRQGLQLHPKGGGSYDLFTQAGRFERFAGPDIVRVRAATTSLMPDGLEAALTVNEVRDLAALPAVP